MSKYNITVNFANCDHWHWSLNGGADSMVMTGTTADIEVENPENGYTITVKGVDANHNILAQDSVTIAPEPDAFDGETGQSLGTLTHSYYTTVNTGNRGNNKKRINWVWSDDANATLVSTYPNGSVENVCYSYTTCAAGTLKFSGLTTMFGTSATGETQIQNLAQTGTATTSDFNSYYGDHGSQGDESNWPPSGDGEAIQVAGLGTVLITRVSETTAEFFLQGQAVRITGTARNMNETVVRTNPRGGGGTSTYTYSSPSVEEEFDITSQWPDGAGIIKSKTYYLQTRQAEFNAVANTNYASNLYLDVSGRIYTNQAANWRNIKVYIEGVLAYTQPDDLPVRGEVDYLNIDS